MKPTRYIELDLLRSLAVIGMIVFHLTYDLMAFYQLPVNVFSGGWLLFERAIASLFLLLVGVSFAISWDRHRSKHPEKIHRKLLRKYVRRGIAVIACGLLVSIVTYIADPETFVRFGILHLIGVEILLLPFFAPWKEWNIALSAIVFLLSPIVTSLQTTSEVLLPLGVMPPDFRTVDYFPLLPWFGVTLFGLGLGHALYVRGKAGWTSENWILRKLSWPGRHALVIYLLHQPILLGILALLGLFGIVPNAS